MKKKKTALVFTAFDGSWYKNMKNILLGEWCLVNISNRRYKNYDFIVSRKEKKKEKIIHEEKLCNYYYERLLEDFIENLGKFYDLKWNKRSWEVFCGPWLHRYVAIIYDRYYALEYVIRNYNINKVKISDDYKFSLLTQDHKDFKIKSQTDDWNFKLFSKIYIKYFNNRKIKKNKINFSKKKLPIKNNFLQKLNNFEILKNNLLKFFLKYLDNFTKKIYYKTYLGNKKLVILLNLFNKNLPLLYDFDHQLIKIDHINHIRNKKFSTKFNTNKFESILRELIFEFLPFYYLEQIDNLKNLKNKLFLPKTNNKVVITALGLYQENIFKFWLSNALSQNSKLYCLQHGNNYGTSKTLHSEFLEKKLCDKFFTWGWNDKSKKTKELFCIKLAYKKKFKKASSKKILIIGATPQAYRAEITSGNLFSLRSNIYLNILKETLELSKKFHLKNIDFRPHPSETNKNYDLGKYVKNKFSYVGINNSKIDLLKSLDQYGLAVYIDDSTSFLESMSLNKPTMIILSKRLYFDHHRNSAIYSYKKLKTANILHESPESLIRFIKKIDFNYELWWSSNKTQTIKNQFCSKYCKYEEKPLSVLKKI